MSRLYCYVPIYVDVYHGLDACRYMNYRWHKRLNFKPFWYRDATIVGLILQSIITYDGSESPWVADQGKFTRPRNVCVRLRILLLHLTEITRFTNQFNSSPPWSINHVHYLRLFWLLAWTQPMSAASGWMLMVDEYDVRFNKSWRSRRRDTSIST